MRYWPVWIAALAVVSAAPPVLAQSGAPCGELVTLSTHGKTSTSYSLQMPPEASTGQPRIALVLLPGGPGFLNLDAKGCPHNLTGNSLCGRSRIFIATAS